MHEVIGEKPSQKCGLDSFLRAGFLEEEGQGCELAGPRPKG